MRSGRRAIKAAVVTVAATMFTAVASAGAWADASTNDWTLAGSLSLYLLPDDDPFLLPVTYAERDRLHLEARYNYEQLETASLWGGWNLAFGETVTVESTPMVGIVFGDAGGIAPGLELAVTWRNVELYSESEHVFDLEGVADDFFYAWSELTFAPAAWLAFGVAAQRTHAYQTDVDIQRGLLLELCRERASIRGCLFNLDRDDSFGIVAVAWGP